MPLTVVMLSILIGFSIGLMGGAHCLGMCGGVMGALTMAVNKDQRGQRMVIIAAYNIGRILSYVFIALLFYALIDRIENYFALYFMRVVAGILLIAMGLYLADWWRGLVYLEKAGAHLWRLLQPLSQQLVPVDKPGKAILLGMIWGWLPCGLIYSALAYSATANSAFGAAAIMFSFALGTLPAVVLGSVMMEALMGVLRHRGLRTVMALLLIVFGMLTLYAALGHSHHDESREDAHHYKHQDQHHH